MNGSLIPSRIVCTPSCAFDPVRTSLDGVASIGLLLSVRDGITRERTAPGLQNARKKRVRRRTIHLGTALRAVPTAIKITDNALSISASVVETPRLNRTASRASRGE